MNYPFQNGVSDLYMTLEATNPIIKEEQRIQAIDFILTQWARWSNDRKQIRRWTGLGPGHISEAGVSSSMGRWVVKETGEVWQDEPVEIVSEALLERISPVISSLPDEQRIVVWHEYKGLGSQKEKARKLLLNHSTYRSYLRRGRLSIASEIL